MTTRRYLLEQILLLLLFIRPHRTHSVHKMRPVATDGVKWSLSVCRSRSWALQKRLVTDGRTNTGS